MLPYHVANPPNVPNERLAVLENKVQNLSDDFHEHKEETARSFRDQAIRLESLSSKVEELLKYKWFLGVLVVMAPQLWPVIKSFFGG